MEVDEVFAAKLGFPKLRYVFVERERRWLCRSIPVELVLGTDSVTDLYVAGSNLRLREALPLSGALPMRRLTRKVDADASTRLISSIYLQEHEFVLLRTALQGSTIRKRRHRLKSPPGVVIAVDEFEGPLSGLLLVEAEFETDAQLQVFDIPPYAGSEVTADSRYSGGSLAVHGLPVPAAKAQV